MDIRAMHYDVKMKLNKLDSQKYEDLLVPEIDWKLNEAIELYIKLIAQPRYYTGLGFEVNQRTIDDIRTIVVNNRDLVLDPENFAEIPEDYMFYVSGKAILEKDNCGEREARCIVIQHDDIHERSAFNDSSYEWRELNIRFYDKGIKYFETDFKVNKILINYIKKHPYVHNAQDFLPDGEYELPNGIILSGTQELELPEHTHREIVDLAVLIITGDLQLPDYQTKQVKVKLNQTN